MTATKTLRPQFASHSKLMIAALSVCLTFGVNTARAAQMGGQNTAAPAQKLFASPEEALQALESAVKAKDRAALGAIFGPDNEKLESGDAVEDNNALDNFALRLAESATLKKVNDSKYTLVVGAEKYPFPIPIVKQGEQWRFDTQAGIEEILNRRIGENELSAILTCRAYVLAQWQYYTESKDTAKDGLAVYAQKFLSTAGTHDGLYWDTALNEEPSPWALWWPTRARRVTRRDSNARAGKPKRPPAEAMMLRSSPVLRTTDTSSKSSRARARMLREEDSATSSTAT